MAGHMDALKSSLIDSEFYATSVGDMLRCYLCRGYVNPTYATKTRGYFETLKQFKAVAFRKGKTRL